MRRDADRSQRPQLRLLCFVASLGLLPGCGPARYDPGTVRNVLLISIDTLRADALGVYGAPLPTSPHIDRIADEGVHFELAIASNPLTLPSHTTLLTGVTPLVHGVHDNDESHLGAALPTLAEILGDAGLATAGFVGASVLDGSTGLGRGFAVWDEVRGRGSVTQAQRMAGEVVERALAFLEARGDDPFFLFVHLYDPHYPYKPPEPYRSRFSGHPYEGEVAYADGALALLFDALRGDGRLDETVVVVTADHGESFGEHEERTHGYYAYQSTQRIPLIIRAPGLGGGRALDGVVGLHDVAPTILGLLGLPVPPEMEGLDLSSRLRGEVDRQRERRVYCESYMPTKVGCNPIFALVTPRWKYIGTTRPELYDLDADPGEEHDLAARDPERAASFARDLDRRLADSREGDAAESDPEQKAQLAALGYLTGPIDATAALDPSKPDPKDRYRAWHGIRRVNAGIREGELEGAREIAKELLREFPDLVELHRSLGEIAFAEESWRESLVHYELYLTLLGPPLPGSSAFPRAAVRRAMGVARLELGQPERALGEFDAALRLAPGDATALRESAVALVALGRTEEAADRYARLVELAPDDPSLRRVRDRLLAGETTDFDRSGPTARLPDGSGSVRDHLTP